MLLDWNVKEYLMLHQSNSAAEQCTFNKTIGAVNWSSYFLIPDAMHAAARTIRQFSFYPPLNASYYMNLLKVPKLIMTQDHHTANHQGMLLDEKWRQAAKHC